MDEMFVVDISFCVHVVNFGSTFYILAQTVQKFVFCSKVSAKNGYSTHISGLSSSNPDVVFMSLWVELGPSHS